MEIAYKLRLYPTLDQQVMIAKTIGCARFVYNWGLEIRREAFIEEKRSLSYGDCSELLTSLKQDEGHSWLREVDKFALQNALRNLDNAYVNFFEGRANYPRFKSKHQGKQKYRTNMTNNNIRVDTEKCRLKLPKLGWIKFRSSKKRPIKGRILNVTVSQTSDAAYYASICCEIDQLPYKSTEPRKYAVGVDLGLKDFCILSSGEKIENPKHFSSSQKKLARFQRRLAKKTKGSKNRDKARKAVAKQHQKVANQRNDFLHKESRKLINENQVICIEDLNVRGMVKNRTLSKAISDAGWGIFQKMLTYKAAWHDRQVVVINRFYPSTQLCNGCKTKNPMLTLSDRKWTCPVCKMECDRDVNAAKNILCEGLRLSA